MAGMQKKDFDQPDETRRFDHGRIDLVTLPRATIGRAVFEPGWRWSNDVKPIAGTDSCQAPHTGYVISGRLATRMDDGQEMEFGPGESFEIPPVTTAGPSAKSPWSSSTSPEPSITPNLRKS